MALFGEDLVTRTKFIAPQVKGAHIRRERLHRLLDGTREVPLTVVVAGAGYGKSTVLAGYVEAAGVPGLWYELGERDADPQVIALHLAHLCHRAFPGSADRALAALERPGGAAVHWAAAAEALADGLLDRVEQHTLLVLDDFEVLDRAPEALQLVNHFVGHLPPRLHVVIASRTRPGLANLARWRLEGNVLAIDQDALAFDVPEARALVARLGRDSGEDAPIERMVRETAGWPMAVQLVARRLGDPESAAGKTARGTGDLSGGRDALITDPEARRDLFEYLAREVLDVLGALDRDFLLATAPLTRLDAAVCDALLDRADSADTLLRLADRGILLVLPDQAPGGYRLHHLFRDFLLARLGESGRLGEARRSAASALSRVNRLPEAIDLWLAAGSYDVASERILAVGPGLVRQGMFETVAHWIRHLPDARLALAPELAILMGDACRLAARFDSALAWYDRALAALDADPDGRSRALAAKAQVFLDTVRPAMATALLEEAARLATDPGRRADLQVLLAENALNQGDPARAEALLGEAGPDAPAAAEVRGRLLLRTGRLLEARTWLKDLLVREGQGQGAVKAHREAALVLSLVEAFLGNAEAAREHAMRGLERARTQGAAWGEAVGLIRAGHAALVAGQEREAGALYRKSLDVADAVGVDRLTAEPLVGLTILAGRRLDPAEAERHAKRAAEAASKHGDTWMVALTQLGLGVAFAAAGDFRAAKQLEAAEKAFGLVGDPHGELKARLWAARLGLAPAEGKGAAVRIAALASRIRECGLGKLLAGPTFLGFGTREQALAFLRDATGAGTPGAVLVAALEAGASPSEVQALLAELGITVAQEPESEPAAALRIRSLGAFRVWRGGDEIDRRAWGRKIALQLFHLLMVHRNEVLPKSRIVDMLWPDLDPAVADGTFRVALNTLNKTLEPDRPAGREPRYILRQGTAYGLRLGEELWLDAAEFERLLDGAAVMEAAGQDPAAMLAQALDLSDGDFLAEFTEYGTWCDRERERLSVRFSDSAAKLARLLLERGEAAGCGQWAQRLVERDPCAEPAYRLLMVAQYRQGDRTGAMRTYERCVEALAHELDVEPMPETTAVYEAIVDMADAEAIGVP